MPNPAAAASYAALRRRLHFAISSRSSLRGLPSPSPRGSPSPLRNLFAVRCARPFAALPADPSCSSSWSSRALRCPSTSRPLLLGLPALSTPIFGPSPLPSLCPLSSPSHQTQEGAMQGMIYNQLIISVFSNGVCIAPRILGGQCKVRFATIWLSMCFVIGFALPLGFWENNAGGVVAPPASRPAGGLKGFAISFLFPGTPTQPPLLPVRAPNRPFSSRPHPAMCKAICNSLIHRVSDFVLHNDHLISGPSCASLK